MSAPLLKSVGRFRTFEDAVDLLVLLKELLLFVPLHPLARTLEIGTSLLTLHTLINELVLSLDDDSL